MLNIVYRTYKYYYDVFLNIIIQNKHWIFFWNWLNQSLFCLYESHVVIQQCVETNLKIDGIIEENFIKYTSLICHLGRIGS